MADRPPLYDGAPETVPPVVTPRRPTPMTELKQRPGDQPLPIPNDEPDIQTRVIADIETRRELGIQRYGVALQAHNGRDAMRDLYEELLDGAMYAKQVMVERDAVEAAAPHVAEHIASLLDEKAELLANSAEEAASLGSAVGMERFSRRSLAFKEAARIAREAYPTGDGRG